MEHIQDFYHIQIIFLEGNTHIFQYGCKLTHVQGGDMKFCSTDTHTENALYGINQLRSLYVRNVNALGITRKSMWCFQNHISMPCPTYFFQVST